MTARRGDARWCSDRCRKAASRASERAPETSEPGPVLTRTVEAVGNDEGPLSAAALVLAARIDAGRDSGSALAAVVREWRSLLEAVAAGSIGDVDPVERARAGGLRVAE